MKKNFLTILLFALFSFAKAQVNLVPNPSFDQTITSCPNALAQSNKCAIWYNPNNGTGLFATPDYFNTCGTNNGNAPNTGYGNCSPRAGSSGMIGLCVWNSFYPNYREYMTTTLTCSMKVGVTYTLSFWVNNGSHLQGYTVDKIGLLLTNGPVVQSGPASDNYAPILMTPQLETAANTATTSWRQFTTAITATSNWDHVTIGNFRDNSNTNVTLTWGPASGFNYMAYYYFDDIAVLTPTTSFYPSLTINQSSCNNPINSISIVPTNTNYAYTYNWSSGGYTSGSATNLLPGVYIVTVTASNGCTTTARTTSFTIQPAPPIPTISITANTTTYCAGKSITLTATGTSLSYVWFPNGIGASIVVNPTVGTTYTVVGVNGSSCTNIATYYVGPPQPNPTISVSSPTRCSGNTASLSASGASSYIWQPGSIPGNPYVVNPNVATNYTVIGTATNGCIGTTVYNLAAPFPNPTVNILATSTVACPGNPSNLTVNGANTYYWYPVNSTGSSISITPTTPTVYYAFGFDSLGCQGYSSITINPGQNIGLSVSDVTFCTNATFSTPITAYTSFTTGVVAYNWQPIGQNGQTVNVNPTANTIYTVSASSPAGCPGTATLSVVTITNCCTQSTVGLTQLGSSLGGIVGPGSYFVPSSITLSVNTTLSNSEFLFMPGQKITVPSGITLSLNNSHLYACGVNIWKGIEVSDGGRIITSRRNMTTLIEDAEVAIELDNISLSNSSPNAPIDIDRVIFNKNYISIRISNSDPNLTTLPVGLTSCVFASRKMTFTAFPSALSWPSADNNLGNLRAAGSPTTDLPSPYNLQGFQSSTLKLPYVTQPAHIGIQIINIGNSSGIMPPSNGVVLGSLAGVNVNDFNLFDGLGKGIEITDAGLSTFNNVFQDMKSYTVSNSSQFGGWGIEHIISGQMNARLNLSPPVTNQSTDYGNRFWNCYTGAEAKYVYDVDLQFGIFRSTHLATNPNFAPGADGFILTSNRFNYAVKFCEFNNISRSLWCTISSGPYDINGSNNGTYAQDIDFSQNYFGAEVNSFLPIGPGGFYSNFAITIDGFSTNNWNINGNCKINSNKLDRVFRGIRVNDLDSYPVEIGGNEIYVLDDHFVSAFADQYGILAYNSLDNLFINKNDVKGNGPVNSWPWNQRLKLIRSKNNQSNSNSVSPIITCNNVYDAFVGFEFYGSQPNTEWTNNTMYQKMNKGLELVNNGQIGIQGNAFQACNNKWDNNSNTAPDLWLGFMNNQTFVDALSNANPGSFLWCDGSSTMTMPATNGTGGGMPFATTSSLDKAKGGNPDCAYQIIYQATPSQRITNSNMTTIKENIGAGTQIEIFPNPTKGNLTIASPVNNESLSIKIFDFSGKLVYSTIVNSNNTIELSFLKEAVYSIEIKDQKNYLTRKKLVILSK